ncbi:hypothetical protein SAMN05421848_2890 [Kushneria avicenniae]|uniref:Uncharacterized protein n=1 Tax=Kushneria avicenniae TaxID=402385 RepID=A0A1I1MAC9_9GAMM|nr:hypothetical protein [Kushneria avicenniae]SFC82427.1 hypothetical protein SAMN05421848_2890 [Kushneria avicenniae]
MPRERSLSIKDKWSLDNQLGEMLRSLEKEETVAPAFFDELEALMKSYDMSHHDTLKILELIQQSSTDN